uniref:Uncharacterized protein n=1 Tax=Cannabis sativa TaxID=3483 RepID=A0A803PDJ2_CANSA
MPKVLVFILTATSTFNLKPFRSGGFHETPPSAWKVELFQGSSRTSISRDKGDPHAQSSSRSMRPPSSIQVSPEVMWSTQPIKYQGTKWSRCLTCLAGWLARDVSWDEVIRCNSTQRAVRKDLAVYRLAHRLDLWLWIGRLTIVSLGGMPSIILFYTAQGDIRRGGS